MEQINWEEPIVTEDGRSVRILATDVDGDFPVVGIVGETVWSWTVGGTGRWVDTPNIQNVKLKDQFTVVITNTGCYESDNPVFKKDVIANVLVFPRSHTADFIVEPVKDIQDHQHISSDYDTTTRTFTPKGFDGIM